MFPTHCRPFSSFSYPTTRKVEGEQTSKPLIDTVVDLFDDWAAKAPGRIAAEWQGESLTYAALRSASLHVSQALLSTGVRPRDRVPLLTQMSLEMLPAVIGILRVGACYVPMDLVIWSRSRVEAALFELASPVALVTSHCPGLQLPVCTVNFQKEWLYSPVTHPDNLYVRLDAQRRESHANDLAWIVFTSGTTGKPKGVMVYHKAIYALSILKHSDDLEETAAKGGGRCLLPFSIAFDGCAGVVWPTLSKGGTLVMASATNFQEVATSCDLLNLTPSMLAILDPAGAYDCVRYIYLGAEAPNLEVARQWIRPDRKVYTTYGPSETTCVISFGEIDPDQEVTFGDLIPGVEVILVDEMLQERDHGEVLIAGPGLAAGYLNNPTLTAAKFIELNGKRFYRTGDLANRTKSGKLVWAGRADSLLKNRGFLINLETETEPALLAFPSVRLAVALKWRDKLVGCVQPGTVDVHELREFMQKHYDSFIIPDKIFSMDSFPLNVNSKTDRRALEDLLEKEMAQDDETFLLEDGSLPAYDTLCLAFSQCLHVSSKELNRDSSFTRLGGNSLTAIRLCNLLKKRGFPISVVQILKTDTIGSIEDMLNSLPASDRAQPSGDISSDHVEQTPATATDTQKQMFSMSLDNPQIFGLVGVSKYIGDPCTAPTPSELHNASVKVLSAHSIYQTRFDLTDFTLSNLGRLNLQWEEVSVKEQEFEGACVAAEEQAWEIVAKVTRSEHEVPYCAVTCISVPDRKALAFVTRTHHVLTDLASSGILSRDVEQVLAGHGVPSGPRFEDYARFMQTYASAKSERLLRCFENMMKKLPATSVLPIPAPQTPQSYNLMRVESNPGITRSALDASARNMAVTPSTMIYAAWALFLHKITTWDRVGFSVSLSGRTVPWEWATSVVGPLQCRSLFSTVILMEATVNDWLAQVHQVTLNIMEFDGLTHALPPSLMSDPRTNTTGVFCFLDMPSGLSNWTHRDCQKHSYTFKWCISQHREQIVTELEVQLEKVDLGWSKEITGFPGKMLNVLVNTTPETRVADLIRSTSSDAAVICSSTHI